MRKFVLEQPIFVFSEFFGAFKKNFRKSILMGLASFTFVVAFVISFFITAAAVNVNPGVESYLHTTMNMIAGVVFLSLCLYIYPQIACLDLSFSAMFKNAAILCIAGFKRNVVTILLYIVTFSILVFLLPFSLIALAFAPFAQLAFLGVFNAYPVIQKYIVNPFYEAKGEKSPEIPDYHDTDTKASRGTAAANIFTDLGGSENPVNKKNVKTTGKIIK
jgi:uncharacterized membrane protein YesL